MTVNWWAFDFKTGARLWQIPTEKLGSVSRLIGDDRSASIQPRWSDQGKQIPGVLEGTAVGRVMTVAIDGTDDRILWGGLNRRRQRPIVGPAATIVADTLEAYLRSRYINTTLAWTNVQPSQIAADVLATITDIPLVVDVTPTTGALISGRYVDTDNKRVRDVLDDLAGLNGGIEWTIEVEWTDTSHEAIRYRARVAPRLGTVNTGPRWIHQPGVAGAIIGGELVEDYGPETGANDTIAFSSGEGTTKPRSTRYVATDLLAAGWAKFERRFTPATSITSTATLDQYAEADHAQTRLGLSQLTIVANLDAAPRLNLDWWLGDTIGVDITSETFPAQPGPDGLLPGYSADLRVIGWTLDLDARTLTPLTKERV
jgi:hypothetical protein